jgi:hypothetical protein
MGPDKEILESHRHSNPPFPPHPGQPRTMHLFELVHGRRMAPSITVSNKNLSCSELDLFLTIALGMRRPKAIIIVSSSGRGCNGQGYGHLRTPRSLQPPQSTRMLDSKIATEEA